MAIKLNWFKMLWLNSDERKALKEASNIKDVPYETKPEVKKEYVVEEVTKFPYKNILYSRKNITVIFWSGAVISKMGVERDIFQRVKDAKTEGEIEDILIDKVVIPETDGHYAETVEEKQQIKDNLHVFRNNPDFEIVGDEVFLKPAKLALPAVVAATFIEILEKRKNVSNTFEQAAELINSYKTLKMFWLKLALNTLPQSREDTLVFVKKNDVRLTKNGNLVLYRRIVTQGTENKALVKFISQEYFKVKKWKKSPKNFQVVEEYNEGNYGAYKVTTELKKFPSANCNDKSVGILADLYANLENMVENTYTSYHNKGDHTIKIGGLYKIDDDQINLDNGVCAAGGLHAACVNYNYSSFGDTPIVVLVNPSKAITVPKDETGKLRTTEMFIACINDKPHGEHFDDDSLDVFDEEYHDLTIQELEEAVKDKSFDSLKVKKTEPAIAIDNLAAIKDALKNRVKQLV